MKIFKRQQRQHKKICQSLFKLTSSPQASDSCDDNDKEEFLELPNEERSSYITGLLFTTVFLIFFIALLLNNNNLQ